MDPCFFLVSIVVGVIIVFIVVVLMFVVVVISCFWFLCVVFTPSVSDQLQATSAGCFV